MLWQPRKSTIPYLRSSQNSTKYQGKLEPQRCFLHIFHFNNYASTNTSGCNLNDNERLVENGGRRVFIPHCACTAPQWTLWFAYWICGPQCPRIPLAEFTLLGKKLSDLHLTTLFLNSTPHFHFFTPVGLWGNLLLCRDHIHPSWSHHINTGYDWLQREPRTSL